MSLMRRFSRSIQSVNAPACNIRLWPLGINYYCGEFQFQSATDSSLSQWRSSSYVARSKFPPGKRSLKRVMGERSNITSDKTKRTTQIHQLTRKIKDLSQGGLQPQTSRKDKQSSSQQVKPSNKNSSSTKSTMRGPFSAFVSCLPGLEPILLQEVQYLLSSTQQQQQSEPPIVPRAIPGGVKVILPSLAHLYVLHLYLGTASHVYLRLNDDGIGNSNIGIPPLFRARGFPELQRKLKELIHSQRWDLLFNVPRSGISVDSLPWKLHVHVTTSKSKLMHTKAVEERVRQTIGESLGISGLDSTTGATHSASTNAEDDKPVVRLLVRIDRDEVQFSLDTSSSSSATPLHMRGYRLNPHKAPLREDLAYALLMAGGLKPSWDMKPLQSLFGTVAESESIVLPVIEENTEEATPEESVLLFDPLCGSGTISIEAASILAGLPPGRLRQSPPFFGTKLCNIRLWDDMKTLALPTDHTKRKSVLVAANDINTEAINAAKSNAKRAGVDQFIDFSVGSFKIHPLLNQTRKSSALRASRSRPLIFVSNPPYGHRLSTDNTHSSIYMQIAKALKSLPCEVQCTMIGNDPRSLRESTLPLKVAFSTKHGGMNVVAMTGTINN